MADAATVRRLTIWLFGRPRCKTARGDGVFPARPGARALFVALAFAGRPLERDWLAAALWPDVHDTVAGANLRRHVSYVELWLRSFTGCERPIVRTRGKLALDPALVEWLDVRAFEDAVANGDFEEASEVYGGDLLTGLEDEWILPERERLRARYDEVLFSLVSSARARSETETALRYARRGRATDPYNEAWLRTTMRVRYAAGDRAGALGEYESFKVLLEHDLDLEPMPETFMLADSMRRLEGNPAAAPLALEATTFVGRANELRQLEGLIAQARLVTVSGEPGVGKSRLTLRCVRALASRYDDGVVVVDAAAANDASGLERLTLRALEGVVTGAPGDSIEDLASRIEAILVFDGCERIRNECATLARRLLAAGAKLRIVASSRLPLGVHGEAILRLGPLRAQDGALLFFERIRVARPETAVSGAEMPIVERICSKLDGLPLGIELAAARGRMTTLSQLEIDVRRFADRPGFDLLYSMYESSYGLLNSTERAVLRRLGAFVNGWNSDIALAACSEIASSKQVLAAFTSLVEHSLVIPPGVSEVGARYSMLDATRDFALYRARALGEIEGDARAQAVATARYYAAFGRRLRGEHAAQYYPELERDRENIEAALAALWRGDADDRVLATDLSLAVSRFWADQGFAREGEGWLRKSLTDVAGNDPKKRLELLRVIGTLTRDLGDYESSFRDFSELVRLHESARSDIVEIAKAQTMAANAARMLGEFDDALARTRFAYTVFAENGEDYFAAWAIYALGTTLLSAGRFAEAAVELERATDLFNDAGAISDSSSSIANLSLCHYYEGRLGVAHELTRESLARAAAVGHRYYYAHAALNEALILNALGEPLRAWPRVVEVSTIGASLGAQDVTIACAEVACAVLAEVHPEDAAILLGSVDNARERVGARRFPVDEPSYEAISEILRTSLGEERFAALRARGRVTMLRDAVRRLAEFEIVEPIART